MRKKPSRPMMHTPSTGADRGVSIAVTHVLTIGITTILIAMLMMSGSTLLESETDRSAESSLETIGERLAGEIANVEQIAAKGDTEYVRVTADHPRTVTSSQYTVQLLDDCSGDDAPLIGDSPCLRLTSQEVDVVVNVPVPIDGDDISEEKHTVSGGTIEIAYDGGRIELEEANR